MALLFGIILFSMEKFDIVKHKIFLIIIAFLFLISLGISLTKHFPEKKNYEHYINGLDKYEKNCYQDAYIAFGKVSTFSKLKHAAVYRQALCANKLGEKRKEKSKYNYIIYFYPRSVISMRAKYQKAQLLYNSKSSKSAKLFKRIIKSYPDTDYALASMYYLASIDSEKSQKTHNKHRKSYLQEKATANFKEYLIEAPTGKFAIPSIKKWVALGVPLKNEDNLIIAKAYQENSDYKNANIYLQKTSIADSWPYLAINSYYLQDYAKLKYYVEQGLKSPSIPITINSSQTASEQDKDMYKAIDFYIKKSSSAKDAISYLISLSNTQARGADYLMYKNCINQAAVNQPACYNTLYYKFPRSNFAAEALSNIIYSKIKQNDYEIAIRLGKKHLAMYDNVKSTPKVLFWMAKSYERVHKYDSSRMYYKRLLKDFPDDYYAYHSFLNLNHSRYFNVTELNPKPILFPYKNSNNTLITELVKVRDYGLINQLYGSDPFIKSWLMYEQGNYAASATIARDAIDKLKNPPPKNDLRWRLVYPLHYYDNVISISQSWRNDPILILAIIREESYFNPEARSAVGAMGLMQLMPTTAIETARRTGMQFPYVNMLYNPEINIKLGNAYFSNLVKSFEGKELLAVLSYNGGMGSVQRWKSNLNYADIDEFIEQVPYPETKNYLKKVYKSYWNYLRLYDGIH